jgi:cell division septation protein DedD
MMGNERGGIISKIFIIPAGVVVIMAMFLLGYYVGRGQGKKTDGADKPPALPDVVSQYIPKTEDFTFYKTLTEKGDKSVSVDLKAKPGGETSSGSGPEVRESSRQHEETRLPAKAEPKPQMKPQQEAKKEPPAPRSASSKGRYTIQVSAYTDRRQADEEVRSMKKRGYAAFVLATELPNKGTWYRVRVGSFSSRESAEKLAAELKSKEGISSFITSE